MTRQCNMTRKEICQAKSQKQKGKGNEAKKRQTSNKAKQQRS